MEAVEAVPLGNALFLGRVCQEVNALCIAHAKFHTLTNITERLWHAIECGEQMRHALMCHTATHTRHFEEQVAASEIHLEVHADIVAPQKLQFVERYFLTS